MFIIYLIELIGIKSSVRFMLLNTALWLSRLLSSVLASYVNPYKRDFKLYVQNKKILSLITYIYEIKLYLLKPQPYAEAVFMTERSYEN